MKTRILPPFLTLLLFLQGCGTRTSTAMPESPTASIGTVAARPTSTTTASNSPVPPATDTPLPPALPLIVSPSLARIDFLDENNGWGIALNDNGHVLRTVDGGKSWLNATPAGIESIGLSTSLAVLNASTVWVLVPGTDYFSGILYRTIDGGITWNSNPVPFGGGFLQFIDANVGRALADRGAGAGSEAVELFQTSDAGVTWTSVFHNDPTQPGASDELPLGGIKNGMTFLDASTGWVTGSIPKDGDIYLYATHDGGVTWSQQDLPLPAGFSAYQYLAHAPVFFGMDGFLPLSIYMPDSTGLTFFSTHDGGRSWIGDPADPKEVITPGLAAISDAMHIWSWDGGSRMYTSADGAQTWKTMSPTLNVDGNLSQMEFVTGPAGGFTGWALANASNSGVNQLYRTTDGYNWTLLNP